MTFCGKIDEIFRTCENYKTKYKEHYISYARAHTHTTHTHTHTHTHIDRQTDRLTDTRSDREIGRYIELEGCKNPR